MTAWILAGAACIAILVCYALTVLAPGVGLYHDDGIYLVTAQALAEGKGYRIISLPIEIPQTKYPILFPLSLSMVWRLAPEFPQNVLFLKFVPLSAALVWFVLVFKLIRRETKRTALTVGIVLLTAASPHVLYASTTLLSETLFAAFAWGALLPLVRLEESESSKKTILVAALLSAAAFHTRTIGVTLIAAGGLALLLRRRWRIALGYTLLCGLLAAPWFIWVGSNADAVSGLYSYYTSANYLSWNLLSDFTWSHRLTVVAYNGLLATMAPGMLLTFGIAFLWPLYLLLGVAAIVGFVSLARTRVGVLHLFVLFYVGNVLLWAWPPTRLLLPLLPLFLWYVVTGLERIGRSLGVAPAYQRGGSLAAVVAIGAVTGWSLGRATSHAVQNGTACYAPACESQHWVYYRETMEWLDRNVSPDATLIANLDPLLYLKTGRKAVRAFAADPFSLHYESQPDRQPLGPPTSLIERIEAVGADYLVLMPSGWFSEAPFLLDQIRALRLERPGLLETAYDRRGTGFRVYRIDEVDESGGQ